MSTKVTVVVEGSDEEQVVVDKTHEANLAPEMRKFAGEVQYRYPNITEWIDLFPISDITGEPGPPGDQGTMPAPYLHPFSNVQGLSIPQASHGLTAVRSVMILDQNHTLMSGEVTINPDTLLILINFTRSFSGTAIIS
mgnify:CR=1 FL=1